ncbi:MAG: hypothetical protein ACYDHW_06645 [Syntrophorhabdaceae bacterium]
MQISPKTIERAIETVAGSLRIYREKIDGAFLKVEGPLTIKLSVRFKPVEGKMEIKTGIKFVTDEVNDSFETMFDENQDDLFAAIDKMAEKILAPAEPSKWFAMPDCRIEAYRQ